MKNLSLFISILISVLAFTRCNERYSGKSLSGTWVNEKEGCVLQLNENKSFKAVNLPIDVENAHSVKTEGLYTFKGVGIWMLDKNKIKLTFEDGGYYYIDISSNLFVKLTDESGGTLIFFDKK